MKFLYWSFWCCVVLLLTHCSGVSERAQLQGDAVVLDQMITGKSSFNQSDYANALQQWQKAADLVDAVWVNRKGAERADSFWYGEQAKEFKGEPYERMMLFFYLGLLYYNEQDYGNAQAAFKQIGLQAAGNEDQVFGFPLAVQLEALSLYALGSEGGYQNTLNLHKRLGWTLPFDPTKIPDYLVIFESGLSPKKQWLRKESMLTFENRDTSSNYRFSFNQDLIQFDWQSIYDLALLKGFRKADELTQTKGKVKDISREVSSHLLDHALSSDSNEAATALAVIGIAGMIFSENIVVGGDVRFWSNLPGSLHYGYLYLQDATTNWLKISNGDLPAASARSIELKKRAKGEAMRILYFTKKPMRDVTKDVAEQPTENRTVQQLSVNAGRMQVLYFTDATAGNSNGEQEALF